MIIRTTDVIVAGKWHREVFFAIDAKRQLRHIILPSHGSKGSIRKRSPKVYERKVMKMTMKDLKFLIRVFGAQAKVKDVKQTLALVVEMKNKMPAGK